jgi:hypothetical protein
MLAIQTFTPRETGVLIFCMQKSRGEILKLCINLKRNRIPKKFGITYPFLKRKATPAKPFVLPTSSIETTTLLRMKDRGKDKRRWREKEKRGRGMRG